MPNFTILLYSKNKKTIDHISKLLKNSERKPIRITKKLLQKKKKKNKISILKLQHVNKTVKKNFKFRYFFTNLSFETDVLQSALIILRKIRTELLPDLKIIIRTIYKKRKPFFIKKITFSCVKLEKIWGKKNLSGKKFKLSFSGDKDLFTKIMPHLKIKHWEMLDLENKIFNRSVGIDLKQKQKNFSRYSADKKNYIEGLGKTVKNMSDLNFKEFFVGLVDGDGYLNFHKTSGPYWTFKLEIEQSSVNLRLVHYLQSRLGCGQVYLRDKYDTVRFVIGDRSTLINKILPIFDNFLPRTAKRRWQYEHFKKAIEAYADPTLTAEQRDSEMLRLQEELNKGYTGKELNKAFIEEWENDFWPIKVADMTEEQLKEKMPKFWVVGFFEAEGSFIYTYPQSGYVRHKFQIAQTQEPYILEGLNLVFGGGLTVGPASVETTARENIKLIIDFFRDCGLIGMKSPEYLRWRYSFKNSRSSERIRKWQDWHYSRVIDPDTKILSKIKRIKPIILDNEKRDIELIIQRALDLRIRSLRLCLNYDVDFIKLAKRSSPSTSEKDPSTSEKDPKISEVAYIQDLQSIAAREKKFHLPSWVKRRKNVGYAEYLFKNPRYLSLKKLKVITRIYKKSAAHVLRYDYLCILTQ